MSWTKRRAQRSDDGFFQVDWPAGMPVGQESAFTSMGEVEQSAMLGTDVVRQAGWRRLVGLLAVLTLLFPIVAAFVVVIIKLG